MGLDIYFTDVFEVKPAILEKAGAFNVSLVNDLPLFVDPFLLFNSGKAEYQSLHDEIIRYLRFLRDRSVEGHIDDGLLEAWFTFREVKQNWLGFSRVGNRGSGLGLDFARALHRNLHTVFKSFGNETVTRGSHLEKLCLIKDGVGRDNISDFTTTLIKEYLLQYTQRFAQAHLAKQGRRVFTVEKIRFNYDTESWQRDHFELPTFDDDFVMLTPKDLLSKDEIWINRPELLYRVDEIGAALPNQALRAQVDRYFRQQLSKKPTDKEVRAARARTVEAFPEIIEYYIKLKEETGEEARSISSRRIRDAERLFIEEVQALRHILAESTAFYQTKGATYEEARARAMFLKDVIENKGGHRIFWVKGEPIRKEQDLHVLYRLTWFRSASDVSREVDDGRGPADFKVSRGAADKSLVEFKLGSNPKLKQNLQKQVAVYQKASDARHALKVITYFTVAERDRVDAILKELKLTNSPDIVLIDARSDNKPSGSKA